MTRSAGSLLLGRSVPALLLVLMAGAPEAHAREAEAPTRKAEQRAEELLARMTLDEKIGQMTQAELTALGDLSEIQDLALGSVLSGGGADPKEGNSREAWAAAYAECQKKALATRLRIPLLYGVDAVHGHNNVLGAVIFPHNIGLGCAADPDLVERVSRATALEVRATGINWTFAPCVTVPRDDRWGRTYEGYSEDPTLVTGLGVAAVRGLQGDRLDDPLAVLGCVKHYVGDGGTTAEVRNPDWPGFGDGKRLRLDQGDTRVTEQDLRTVHLAPYIPALAAGALTVMPSYSSWNGEKCSASHYLLTEVLKKELGFSGFLISDYNAIDQVDPDYRQAIKRSVNAGMDMFMVPTKYREFVTLLKGLVEAGDVAPSRIDDAARRILTVKAQMGLLDEGFSPAPPAEAVEAFGSQAHRELAREAVRRSLVLLKNNGALPLATKGRLHVAGSGADDLGMQCGGWTIDWQGATGPVTTGGTTILQALRASAPAGQEVTYSADGQGADGAAVTVVVAAERPYAEGAGDADSLRLSDEDQRAIDRVRASGSPLVVVLLSGRPMVVNGTLDACDAFMAAWLPGTEGAGVADVLRGATPPTGKLAFSWPRDESQLPLNVGDAHYEPLFSFGFGLTYGESRTAGSAPAKR